MGIVKKRVEIGDLVKFVVKGEDWFPVPPEENVGIVIAATTSAFEGKQILEVEWMKKAANGLVHSSPPRWISTNLVELISKRP